MSNNLHQTDFFVVIDQGCLYVKNRLSGVSAKIQIFLDYVWPSSTATYCNYINCDKNVCAGTLIGVFTEKQSAATNGIFRQT